MSLPPVFYHYFRTLLPYSRTLTLQEFIHGLQLAQRKTQSHRDVLLLLQHRPVYTAGRRQTESSTHGDRIRLTNIGADFVTTTRGGEMTYHGPGQIVGYPLIDLSRYSPVMGARDYVCRMQKMMERHLRERHGIQSVPSEHTGVFLNETTKIGSIGVQARHRLTSHGFALNVTQEPVSWFDQIVACGLVGVEAGTIEGASGKRAKVDDEIPGLVSQFGRIYERELVRLDLGGEGDLEKAIQALEAEAEAAGAWQRAPMETAH